MPNLKQERLAKILADTKNPPKTKKDAMIRAGYAPSTANKMAHRSIGSPVVQKELEKYKVPANEIERWKKGGDRLLQRAMDLSHDSPDPMLLTQVGSAAISMAIKARESGLVKEDDSPQEALSEYHRHLAKVVCRVTNWACTGRERAIRRYLRMLGVELPSDMIDEVA